MSGVQVPVLALFQTTHFLRRNKIAVLELWNFQVTAAAGVVFVDDVGTIAHKIGDVFHWQVIECQCDEGMAAMVLRTIERHLPTLY